MIEKNFGAGEFKEDAVQWEAKIGWRAVVARATCRNWWCLLDEIITDLRRSG